MTPERLVTSFWPMNREPLKLIQFVCSAPLHTRARGDSVITIHAGAWAFCSAGASAEGHTWEMTRGLPVSAAMRLAQYRIGDKEKSTADASTGTRAAAATTSRR